MTWNALTVYGDHNKKYLRYKRYKYHALFLNGSKLYGREKYLDFFENIILQ